MGQHHGVLRHMAHHGVLRHMAHRGVLRHMAHRGVLRHMAHRGVLRHMVHRGVLRHMAHRGVLRHMAHMSQPHAVGTWVLLADRWAHRILDLQHHGYSCFNTGNARTVVREGDRLSHLTSTCRHFLRELREKQVAIKLMDETAAEVVRDAARKWVCTEAVLASWIHQ